MNSQDGNRVYLKPGVVEKFRPETYVRSWSFFGNSMYQIFVFFTIIWSNEPRRDLWRIPCQSAVVGRQFAFLCLVFS